jgi:hypothetical protein
VLMLSDRSLSYSYFSTITTLLWFPVVVNALESIPLAPFHVKVTCRTGRSHTSQSLTPVLCPSASTSCGYFEFPERNIDTATAVTGVYECIDSSVLMDERDEEEGPELTADFAALCDHRTRCHNISITSFNKNFIRYMIEEYGLNIEAFTSSEIRFCCSLSHGKLRRLLQSDKDELVSGTDQSPIHCHHKQCSAGAVGCLTHEMFYDNEDYVDIQPVKLKWVEEEFQSDNNKLFMPTGLLPSGIELDNKDPVFCVFPHLNNELYRYCVMIHSQKAIDNCWETSGHRICCCFVSPEKTTCNVTLPEEASPLTTTTTSAPETTTMVTTTSTAPPTITQKTRRVM